MTMCDPGDVFTIPANLEKTFDQISRAVARVFSQGALPIILGGDHSIGFPRPAGAIHPRPVEHSRGDDRKAGFRSLGET
jgi:arginase family enzyme